MKSFVKEIEDLAVNNTEFAECFTRQSTAKLVVMVLKPKEGIGAELHKLDQLFRVEEGTGKRFLTALGR